MSEKGGLRNDLIEGVRRTLFDPSDDGVLVWPENPDGWTVEKLDQADRAPSSGAATCTSRPVALA